MALTKSVENDRIEVENKFYVQVRTATIIKEDGKELSRSYARKLFNPGTLDSSDNLVNTDLSSEDADVKAIAEAAWTTQVKNDWKTKLISEKPS